MATRTTVSCPTCGYPQAIPEYEGQTEVCAYCGTQLEAISQGVTIPTPVFVGVLSFFAGVLLGPALIATTAGGRGWLERQAREAVRG